MSGKNQVFLFLLEFIECFSIFLFNIMIFLMIKKCWRSSIRYSQQFFIFLNKPRKNVIFVDICIILILLFFIILLCRSFLNVNFFSIWYTRSLWFSWGCLTMSFFIFFDFFNVYFDFHKLTKKFKDTIQLIFILNFRVIFINIITRFIICKLLHN